jgi:hypothetical protein
MEKLTASLGVTLLSMMIGAAPSQGGGESRFVSVPALGVQGDGLPGVVNYILIQLDRTPAHDGPIVQFNEINLGGGSLVGEEWKDGVRRAVRAAAKAVGDEGRDWLITIKNRSMTALTDGASASAAVAVGIMAAYTGEAISPHIALSAQITAEGTLDVVGGLPTKLDAAARAHCRIVVVARDQPLTADWAQSADVASQRRLQLMPVDTLEDAYQVMTGKAR